MRSSHENDIPEERAAYEALDNALSLAIAPLEIELLPTSLAPSPLDVRRDGLSLGVPKPLLILAFKHVKRHASALLPPLESDTDRLTIHKTTCITLLMDAENLTAANARKRRLLGFAPPTGGQVALCNGIRQELRLLDTLLNSPLKKHTKSPVLWSHRRWLINTFYDQVLQANEPRAEQQVLRASSAWTSLLQRELLVVARAGSLHPKNYTAWDYARNLLRLVQERCDSSSSVNMATADVDCAIAFVHEWCRTHVSDVSGWAFLDHLLRLRASSGVAGQIFFTTMDEVERYRYAGAAVWTFLRTTAAPSSCLTVEQRWALLERVRCLAPASTEVCTEVDGVGVLSLQKRHLQLAAKSNLVWMEKFAQCGTGEG